jgi:hypothetical protein
MATTSAFTEARAIRDDSLLTVARRQRRRRVVPAAVVGLLMMSGSFVAFLALEPKPHGSPVLVLARDVVAGHGLTSDDLKVATVDAPGVASVPAREHSALIGQSLAVSLPAGSLLSRATLVGEVGPQPGQAIVGAALKVGAFPGDLVPGAHVLVYAGGGNPVTPATVYSIREQEHGGSETVLSLAVPARASGAVTAAAAAGMLTLVWVTP